MVSTTWEDDYLDNLDEYQRPIELSKAVKFRNDNIRSQIKVCHPLFVIALEYDFESFRASIAEIPKPGQLLEN